LLGVCGRVPAFDEVEGCCSLRLSSESNALVCASRSVGDMANLSVSLISADWRFYVSLEGVYELVMYMVRDACVQRPLASPFDDRC